MRLALIGGTGDIGRALALRFARDTDHEVLIGSRDPEDARAAAAGYERELAAHGFDRSIMGFVNEMAADRADIVVLAVPPYYVGDTIDAIADRLGAGTVLVSPAVGMTRDDGVVRYRPPPAGSVTELAAAHAPADVPVVGAYHNLPADRLAALDTDTEFDTLVVGDDDRAKRLVRGVTDEVAGLRAVDAGPLSNAAAVEALTPLLISIGAYDARLDDAGVVFH
ncbi:NADPH-dependent F420 reductase [Natronobiforma cellulositropha]|uniref:NADPH-dependent F420 reductase n=1 Tax=Natronobiforma cellulositropha TaxID=1679076 RepID=UPI0021D5D111|nr:NADPH-dependent F420 reductase [Natronobiforma cellulositropha]